MTPLIFTPTRTRQKSGFRDSLIVLFISVIWAFSVVYPRPACGLTPDQILIVVRRSDADGQQAARFYCKQRGVKPENIIALDLPAGDQILWSAYQGHVVEPLRQTLLHKKLVGTIRCLLLIGNLPLRVEPDPMTKAEGDEKKMLEAGRDTTGLEIFQQARRVEQLGNNQPSTRPPDKLEGDVKNPWDAREYYFTCLAKAWPAINGLPPDQRHSPADKLASIRRDVEGYAALVDPEPRDRASADFAARHAEWQKQFDIKVRPQLDKKLAATETRRLATPAAREDRLKKVKEARGQAGLIDQITSDVDELGGGYRHSALDNELPLLWRDDYRLNGGQGNGLHGRADKPDSDKQPTMMVARLDGFDRTQPIRIVEDSMAIEKAGLGVVGKFCIDAQGLAGNDPSHDQDQILLDLEKWQARPAWMPLAKDASMVAIPPSQANPIAFYVGCNPADCKFPAGYVCVRGAITITCNPVGAAELHDPRSRQWCNAWLSAGAGAAVVIGTIDQTAPSAVMDYSLFLQALLIDGQTLAEAYWSACNTTSWRTILIGDPLYRPVAKKPAEGEGK